MQQSPDSNTKQINLIEVESSEALRLSSINELVLIVKAVDHDVIVMMTNVRIRVLDKDMQVVISEFIPEQEIVHAATQGATIVAVLSDNTILYFDLRQC